ncbi:MAG: DUF4834 family protein [Bacteroidota bacterium]|nr:DUF4834 family protein [Bacteroidota bacterium]
MNSFDTDNNSNQSYEQNEQHSPKDKAKDLGEYVDFEEIK